MRWRSWRILLKGCGYLDCQDCFAFGFVEPVSVEGLWSVWFCGLLRLSDSAILGWSEILKTLVLDGLGHFSHFISWNFCGKQLFWTFRGCKIPLLARTKRLPAGWQTQLCSGDKAPAATKWRPSRELPPFWVWLCQRVVDRNFKQLYLG